MIRQVQPTDAAAWQAMRQDLWPEGIEDHAAEIAAFFAENLAEPQAVMVAEEAGVLVGLLELSVRYDVAGLQGKRVGYVEGMYIVPAFRFHGLARQLLATARSWARANACEGLASDRAERVIVDGRF